MHVAGSYATRSQAETAAARLRSAGIPAEVAGDDAAGVAPFVALGGSQGFRLLVPDEHVGEARDLLAEVGTPADPTEEPISTPLRRFVVRVRVALVVGLLALLLAWAVGELLAS